MLSDTSLVEGRLSGTLGSQKGPDTILTPDKFSATGISLPLTKLLIHQNDCNQSEKPRTAMKRTKISVVAGGAT